MKLHGMCLLFAILCQSGGLIDRSKAEPMMGQILRGRVYGNSDSRPIGEPDVIVTLCESDETDDHSPTYSVITATVTDAKGAFALVVPPLSPDKTYAIRVRGDKEIWSDQLLGKGATSQIWSRQTFNIPVKYDNREYAPLRHGQEIYGFGTMDVLFATDRMVSRSAGALMVSNKNDMHENVTLGKCVVAVQRSRSPDNLIDYILTRNSDEFYSVDKITTLQRVEFWSGFSQSLAGNSHHDALLFIHGYNTSFNEACRRAAQIAYDIKFDGAVLLYSWPSHDSLLAYSADEEMVEWSEPHFKSFLRDVLDKIGNGHLHIVAHSMGNRLLAKALSPPDLSDKQRSHLGQIVFAAPDINRLIFDQETGLPDLLCRWMS